MDRYHYSAIGLIVLIGSVLIAGIGEPTPSLIVKQYYWKTEDGTIQQTGAGRPSEKTRIEAWLAGDKKIGNAVEKYNSQTVVIMSEPLDFNEVEL